MKKIILLALFALAINFCQAQRIKEDKVPAAVKAVFTKAYPAITKISWELENGNYEAGFDLNKIETSVIISPAGVILETETEIEISALPKGVIEFVATHYADKKVKEASKIVDAKGVGTYEAEVKGMDLIFDANGKFIKESKED